MKKIVIINLTVFLCFLSLTSYKISQEDNVIYWTNNVKLTWNDFTGVPSNDSKDGAITTSGYGYNPYTIKGGSDSVTLFFKTYFIKNESWVKEYAKTKFLLKHEQCHFDINELFSRKFRKLISVYKFSKKTFKETFKELFNKSQKELDAYQDLYDKETDHSKVAAKQLEWEKKVAKELKELDAFSGISMKLYLSK